MASLQSAPSGGPIVSQNLAPPSGAYQSSAPLTESSSSSSSPAPVYTPQRSQPYQPGPTASASGRAGPGWSASGGTVVTLRDGETVGTLAMRYGVPATAILSANGLRDSGSVRPGQQITIPVYSAGGSAVSQRAPEMSAPKMAAATPRTPPKGGVHLTEAGDTLSSIGRNYGVGSATLASANQLQPGTPLKIGQRITIPGPNYRPPVQMAVATPADTVRPIKASLPVAKPAIPNEDKPVVMKVAYAPPQAPAASPVVPASSPVGTVSKNTDSDSASAAEEGGFRWPVRGRVISRFGAKPQGGTNDGINVAVPEGTSVKAAEDGTVAYVGSELQGFGNLVLVRHANGYVTAYAHNSELDVKKGETVRRGQVIAKSGKTGSVTTPQLHFEIRKGSSAIDPMQKLESL